MRLLGIWQIVDGLITIIVYGLFKRYQFSQLSDLSYQDAKAMDSIFGSTFIVISIFGTLLIGLGLFNLVVAKRYLNDQEIGKKWIVWLLVVALFSLVVMDIISLVLATVSLAVLMAKNKASKKIKINEYSRSL
ncbi:hypothetical protein [Carnobacterium maltaromaticum]|uniref:hypothetical protein n=1 Tax=Carnobacterium maltaromaticum TaxID=2751 RepID=UPI00295EF42B|nr:hypothetical protein [Carnobacterium maltaromaticum]